MCACVCMCVCTQVSLKIQVYKYSALTFISHNEVTAKASRILTLLCNVLCTAVCFYNSCVSRNEK